MIALSGERFVGALGICWRTPSWRNAPHADTRVKPTFKNFIAWFRVRMV
jgi:hypothetical protein